MAGHAAGGATSGVSGSAGAAGAEAAAGQAGAAGATACLEPDPNYELEGGPCLAIAETTCAGQSGPNFGDASLPSVAEQWRRLVATRQAAYDQPESHLVLRALELEDYQRLSAHQSGFTADKLGLSPEQELGCLKLLEAAGQIQLVNGKWQTSGEPLVDTRADQRRSRQLRAFWLRQAADALESGAEGTFGYNLFSISDADLEKARTVHARYYREIQELVHASRPNERIVMFATQLYTLDRVRRRFAGSPRLTTSLETG